MTDVSVFAGGRAVAPQRNILVAVIEGVIAGWKAWRDYRQTESELNNLSNRELSDLGITRNDIPAIASRRFLGASDR